MGTQQDTHGLPADQAQAEAFVWHSKHRPVEQVRVRAMRQLFTWAVLLAARTGCAHRGSIGGPEETGIAGFYGPGLDRRRTASGAVFRPEAMTCAHRSLPFGTVLEVTREDDGRSVQVTVTDRGPFVAGRILDLSQGAARALGMERQGLARVRLRIISTGRR